MEDSLAKKIYDLIQNVYSEKNAFDLINEEMKLKQSISENKIKKKKSKKNENKRKRSNSINKINNSKTAEVILSKNNSLEENKTLTCLPNSNAHNENSSEELENLEIKLTNKDQKLNLSDVKIIEKIKKQRKKNTLKNRLNNESTEERNSSNNDNIVDKQYNQTSSDELSISKKSSSILQEQKNLYRNSTIDKDCILTVNLPEKEKLENDYLNGFNFLGVSTKYINNTNTSSQIVNNKMSWRKMTKGKLCIFIK